MADQALRIAAVFAHPADLATEAGGTIVRHTARGDEVMAVILTHGGRLHPNIYVEESRKSAATRDARIADASRETILAVKHEEMRSAAAILGVRELLMFDAEDMMVTADRAIVSRLADAFLRFRPHLVVTHHPGFASGVGSDHCLTGQMACAAATVASQSLANLDGTTAHFVRQIYFCANGVSSRSSTEPGGGPINDLFIDITPVVDRKIRAMDQFVSQGYEGAYTRKCVAGHNGHWGSLAGVTFAEAFMRRFPETQPHFSIPDLALARDGLTAHRSYSERANVWQIPVEPSPTARFLSRAE